MTTAEVPAHAEAFKALGLVFQKMQKLPEAEALLKEAVRFHPDHSEAWRSLGLVYLESGNPAEAEGPLREAIRLAPPGAGALKSLGAVLRELDRPMESEWFLREAARLQPNNADVLYHLAATCHDLGQLAEAEATVREAIRLQPGHAKVHDRLGTLLLEKGRLDRAEYHFREAIRCDPHLAAAHAHLATLLGGRLPESDRVSLERRLVEGRLADLDRADLLFGLAHVCDGRGQFDIAAQHLRQANGHALMAARNRSRCYDRKQHTELVDRIIQTFSRKFFKEKGSFGIDTEQPVFIVGLPRSGSTLLEQVLASHPQIFGAGELPLVHEILESLSAMGGGRENPLDCLTYLDGQTARQLAGQYQGRLECIAGHAPRVVDKLLDNYLHLGLIAVLFPRAKLIHCRRDLRDVAVSCWSTNFGQIRWANCPEDMVACFTDYRRVMAHWRSFLPTPILDVDYEETVKDLEGVARRVVNWCGLEWDPACLAFYRNSRTVRTASVVAVRQPLYRHSVSRWKNYEKDLADLFARLPRPFREFSFRDAA